MCAPRGRNPTQPRNITLNLNPKPWQGGVFIFRTSTPTTWIRKPIPRVSTSLSIHAEDTLSHTSIWAPTLVVNGPAAWPNHVILRSSIMTGPAPPLQAVGRPLFTDFIVNSLRSDHPVTFFHDEWWGPLPGLFVVRDLNL